MVRTGPKSQNPSLWWEWPRELEAMGTRLCPLRPRRARAGLSS